MGPRKGYIGLWSARVGIKLETQPMILPNRMHSLRGLLDDSMQGPNRLKVSVETDGITSKRALAAAELGHTTWPYSAVHNQLLAG